MNLCVGSPPVHPAPEWYTVIGTTLLLSWLLFSPVALLQKIVELGVFFSKELLTVLL